jgi:hypothetical protein
MSSREVRRKVVNISTPAYSFENIHKVIPPNEALEEKGKTQEASWGTAIENEDEVAGEDVKIERPKAQKGKERKMGVGHVSEDAPTTKTIKKQLDNFKQIVKQGFKEQIGSKHPGMLAGQAAQSKLSGGPMFLAQQDGGQWKLQQQNQGADPNRTFSEQEIDTAIKAIGSTWDEANANSGTAKHLEMYLYMNEPNYAYDTERVKSILRQENPSNPEFQPAQQGSDIEQTSLGEAIGLERPRIE